MIQEILMTLLTPDIEAEPLAEFLVGQKLLKSFRNVLLILLNITLQTSDLSHEILHPCERAILADIIGISVQHKSITQFILQYSTHGRHQIHSSSAIETSNIIEGNGYCIPND